MTGRSPPRRSLWGVVAAIAGAIMVLGCLLPWLDTGGVNIGAQVISGTPAGIETTAGVVALVAGIFVLLAGTLMLLIPRGSKVWALAGVLAGVVGVIAAITALADPLNTYIRFVANQAGSDIHELTNSLNALFEVGGLRAGVGVGVYVTLAGSGLSMIAGAAALVVGRRRGAHVRMAPPEHVELAAEIPAEPQATSEPGGEPAGTEIPAEVEAERRESPWTHAPPGPDEQPPRAPEPERDGPPPPDDADHWR